MDQVLVTYASKYGGTAGIAERIGQVLGAAGLPTQVLPVGKVRDVTPYRAVVLGSAVYMFHWRGPAARFLKGMEAELAARPVWLFSSGPTSQSDTDAFPAGQKLPKGLQPVADRIRPRDVAVFGGVYDPAKMGFFDRWIMSNVKAQVGDFRNWEAVEGWAASIARALSVSS